MKNNNNETPNPTASTFHSRKYSPGNIFFSWNILILRIEYSNIKANWHELSQSLKSLSLSTVQAHWLDHFALAEIMKRFKKIFKHKRK